MAPHSTSPFGSSSFERSREASVENARATTTAFSTSGLDRLDPALEATGVRYGARGEESRTPARNHPVRFEQLRACREASVENLVVRGTPSSTTVLVKLEPPVEANGV